MVEVLIRAVIQSAVFGVLAFGPPGIARTKPGLCVVLVVFVCFGIFGTERNIPIPYCVLAAVLETAAILIVRKKTP